jgi:hypothetical protein
LKIIIYASWAEDGKSSKEAKSFLLNFVLSNTNIKFHKTLARASLLKRRTLTGQIQGKVEIFAVGCVVVVNGGS